MKAIVPKDIDEYIAGFPEDIQMILNEIRHTVQQAVPEAEEAIKYAMPAFVLHGNLVHFASFKTHIGFYALPKGNKVLQKEMALYKAGKGSLQFPVDKPMPFRLIAKLVKLRMKENLLAKKK